MGVQSDPSPSSSDEELSEFSDIDPSTPSLRRAGKKSTLRSFCLPDRWLAVVGFIITLAIVLGVALGTSVKRKKPRPETGHYPSDAPFREVIHSNFPDPALLHHNGTWFVYASNKNAGIVDTSRNIIETGSDPDNYAYLQFATSENLMDWTISAPDKAPLQELGEWAKNESIPEPRADVWAPDILARPDGIFVLYYSAAPSEDENVHCIGASVGDTPWIQFKPESKSIACHKKQGGAIDPAPFVDHDGTVYLLYKEDGNNFGNGGDCRNTVPPLVDTPMFVQKMEKDGLTKSSDDPVKILDRTESDGPLVEAPSLILNEGIYILFFSTGCTFDDSYTLKYATSTNITGPYTRRGTILQTGTSGLYAPGSASIVRDGKRWRMAFHARVFNEKGEGIRPMYIADLQIKDTEIALKEPENA
ncbi:unnamed protein product [Periconia digitata]|uniref:Arabinanase/levansucrase/invertase n=1 Tax=Periconia digitata TaxID=1303443 RepID=A0A9W4UAC3_9PLEO|nr:unnamed protein product [Periconia digitata]